MKQEDRHIEWPRVIADAGMRATSLLGKPIRFLDTSSEWDLELPNLSRDSLIERTYAEAFLEVVLGAPEDGRYRQPNCWDAAIQASLEYQIQANLYLLYEYAVSAGSFRNRIAKTHLLVRDFAADEHPFYVFVRAFLNEACDDKENPKLVMDAISSGCWFMNASIDPVVTSRLLATSTFRTELCRTLLNEANGEGPNLRQMFGLEQPKSGHPEERVPFWFFLAYNRIKPYHEGNKGPPDRFVARILELWKFGDGTSFSTLLSYKRNPKPNDRRQKYGTADFKRFAEHQRQLFVSPLFLKVEVVSVLRVVRTRESDGVWQFLNSDDGKWYALTQVDGDYIGGRWERLDDDGIRRTVVFRGGHWEVDG